MELEKLSTADIRAMNAQTRTERLREVQKALLDLRMFKFVVKNDFNKKRSLKRVLARLRTVQGEALKTK